MWRVAILESRHIYLVPIYFSTLPMNFYSPKSVVEYDQKQVGEAENRSFVKKLKNVLKTLTCIYIYKQVL